MTRMKSLRWKALTIVFALVTVTSSVLGFVPQMVGQVSAQAQQCPAGFTYLAGANKPQADFPDACYSNVKNSDKAECPSGQTARVPDDPSGSTRITFYCSVPPGTQGAQQTNDLGAGAIKCANEGFKANQEGKCVGPKVNGQCPEGSTEDPANGNQCIGGAQGEGEDDDCPVPKNQEMRWLYCPVFYGLGLLTNTIDSFINEYLSTGNMIYGNASESGYKQAWQTFRNFGIALVIIAGLVMLVSEAFGLEFIDAYTVRKVLPRLLIAVVGISLSWELCKFLITFFDTLGRAAGSIIYTSFNIGDQGISLWALFTANMFAIGGAAAGATAAYLLLGGTGIISLFGTLVLALLVAAFVLIVRQVLIVACVIFAPLAIAAYVLPNTNKLASFWWDLFIKMLMLYPVATGMIALCKVLGKITLQSAGNNDTAIAQLLATVSAIVIFVAGYGLLAAVPRFVGGAFANISGMINDKSRGSFDRLKNFRAGRVEKNKDALSRGERFKNAPESSLRSGINSASEGVATFAGSSNKMGFLRNKQARDVAYSQRRGVMDAQFMKTDQFAGIQHDDDVLRAVASGRNEQDSRANLKRIYGMEDGDIDRAIAGAKNAGGFSAVRQQAATKQLAAIGTGFDDMDQMHQTIAAAAHGNTGSMAGMVGDMRASSKKAGRFDLGGPGQGTHMKLMESVMKNGGEKADPKLVQKAYVEAARSTDNQTLMRGKPTSTANIANALAGELENQQHAAAHAEKPADRQAATQAAAQIAAKINNMQQSTMFGPEMNSTTLMDGKVVNGVRLNGVGEHTTQNAVETVRSQVSQTITVKHEDGSTSQKPNPNYNPDARSFTIDAQTRGMSDRERMMREREE